LRKNGSKTLSHTALLKRADIELVNVTCSPTTCTYVEKDTARGDDSTGFGIYQTLIDTILVTWTDSGPPIGSTEEITLEARGTDWVAGRPLDQLHKVGSKFTDQVFGALVSLDEPCVPDLGPGSYAEYHCESVNRDLLGGISVAYYTDIVTGCIDLTTVQYYSYDYDLPQGDESWNCNGTKLEMSGVQTTDINWCSQPGQDGRCPACQFEVVEVTSVMEALAADFVTPSQTCQVCFNMYSYYPIQGYVYTCVPTGLCP
jgi:hypothetical protein